MKPYYADHPRKNHTPGVMSCDELRYWIRELLYNEAFGWTHARSALSWALDDTIEGKGVQGRLPQMVRESNRVWIYPSQQLRMSRQIPRILSGELVPARVKSEKGVLVWRPVLSKHPQPIRAASQGRWKVDVMTGKLSLMRPTIAFTPTLPSFANWLESAEEWIPRSDRGPL